MRATAQDPIGAMAVGIDRNKVISTTPDKMEYLLQFSREERDVIRIALLKVDEKKVLFSEQYKLKEVK